MIEIRSRVTWADPLSKSLTRSFQISSRGSGIFVLRGPNAIGKTTLLMAIAYALGDDSLKDDLEKRGCTIALHIGINGSSIEIYRDASKYILRMNGREISDPEEVKDIVREFFDVAYVPVERIVGIRAISRILREFRDAARKIRERSLALLSEGVTILKEIAFYKKLSTRIESMRRELQELERFLKTSKEEIESTTARLEELKELKPLLEDLKRAEDLPNLEEKLKKISKELEDRIREKQTLISMYEELARELATKTVELKTKLDITRKDAKRLEEELKSIEREIERLVRQYEESKVPDLQRLAAAVRKENIEEIERMYRKSLAVLSTFRSKKLEEEKTFIERLLGVCRSAPDPSMKIHGLEMSVADLVTKLREGLATVSDMIKREREKEETWLRLKNACKEILELLKRRERIKIRLKSLEDQLKKLEVEYHSYEIRTARRELPPADEKRLERLEREIEELQREKHELLAEIERLRKVLEVRDEVMERLEYVVRRMGIRADRISPEGLSVMISEMEDKVEELKKQSREIEERIDELRGKIVSYEEMLKERERYVKHYLDDEKHIQDLTRMLQEISDITADVAERLSAEKIEDIRRYLEVMKKERARKKIYQTLYEVISEIGKMTAELIGRVWDHQHGWLRVENIDFERGTVTLVSEDGKVVERGLTEFSRGQLGLASIFPMIHKPTEARFGKVILVDEIGDLDPDRRMEIVNHLIERREKHGDLCFAILVLPDVDVKMLDAERDPDAIR